MRKSIIIIVLLGLLGLLFSLGIVSGGGDVPLIKVSLLRYEPFPVEGGNYFTLWLRVENEGQRRALNARVKFVPEYPFSLKPGQDEISVIGELPAFESTFSEYEIIVDSGAFEGLNELKVSYQSGFGDTWTTETFNILVQGKDRIQISNVTPSTLVPGKATDIKFFLENIGTAAIKELTFTWTEEDNLILPLGSENRKYVPLINVSEEVEVPFTVIADPSTPSGAYNLVVVLNYTVGTNTSKSLRVNMGVFVESSAEFDITVQDSTTTSTTLAIANIGANTAHSVIVRIPKQENFIVTGASTSIIGNLDAGEYTVASFQITPTGSIRNISGWSGERPPTGGIRNISGEVEGNLVVEISFTDITGIRRTVQKEVRLGTVGTIGEETRAQFTQRGQLQIPGSSGIVYIVIGIVGIISIVAFFKFRKRKKG